MAEQKGSRPCRSRAWSARHRLRSRSLRMGVEAFLLVEGQNRYGDSLRKLVEAAGSQNASD